jgi:chromosome segregation ATPase
MKNICVVLALLFAPAAGAAYKCVDENGVTQIGDTPPASCANVMMQEISSSGQLLRKIEPTPTGEQLKARLEEQSRKKEADKIAADQKRKDMALLSSFSAEREFDITRDRNIEPLAGRIKNAQERIAALDKRIQELQDEMEFYKAGKSKASKGREAPMILVHQLERSRLEKETIERSIVDQQKEIEVLKVRFDNDKKRWVALKGAQGKSPDAAPEAPAATPAKAEPPKKRN